MVLCKIRLATLFVMAGQSWIIFYAVITNSFAWQQILHTLSSAWLLDGFFILGISSYHLLRRNELDFFKKSFRLAAVFSFVLSVFLIVQGHMHGAEVANVQPTKLAAMESHWETRSHAPQYLFSIPDPANERNLVELLPIPSGLSLLAFHDPAAKVVGLKDFPREDRPPVMICFLSFRIMIGLAFLFPLLAPSGV